LHLAVAAIALQVPASSHDGARAAWCPDRLKNVTVVTAQQLHSSPDGYDNLNGLLGVNWRDQVGSLTKVLSLHKGWCGY
jgi:hypothetical protein